MNNLNNNLSYLKICVLFFKNIFPFFQALWICDEFEKSEYGKKVSKMIEESCLSASNTEIIHASFSDGSLLTGGFKKVRCLTQMEWLTWRIYVDYKRNASVLIIRFLLYMVGKNYYNTYYIQNTINIVHFSYFLFL